MYKQKRQGGVTNLANLNGEEEDPRKGREGKGREGGRKEGRKESKKQEGTKEGQKDACVNRSVLCKPRPSIGTDTPHPKLNPQG